MRPSFCWSLLEDCFWLRLMEWSYAFVLSETFINVLLSAQMEPCSVWMWAWMRRSSRWRSKSLPVRRLMVASFLDLLHTVTSHNKSRKQQIYKMAAGSTDIFFSFLKALMWSEPNPTGSLVMKINTFHVNAVQPLSNSSNSSVKILIGLNILQNRQDIMRCTLIYNQQNATDKSLSCFNVLWLINWLNFNPTAGNTIIFNINDVVMTHLWIIDTYTERETERETQRQRQRERQRERPEL